MNTIKTKLKFFSRGKVRRIPTFNYGCDVVEVVSDYVYLGITMNYTNKYEKIVYASVQCYSKPDSSSKTFKVSLPPHQYRKLFNPSLWDSGICVKRFFNPRNI